MKQCACGWTLPENVGAITNVRLTSLLDKGKNYDFTDLSTEHAAIMTCPACSRQHSFTPNTTAHALQLRVAKQRLS